MNNKEYEKPAHDMPPGLTTEQQLRRQQLLKEFEAGKTILEAMNSDELTFYFALHPRKLIIWLPKFLGKIFAILLFRLRLYIKNCINGEQE